jgi:hypothetical protein
MVETSDLTVQLKEIDHKMVEIEDHLEEEVVALEEVDLEEVIEVHQEIQEILQLF